MMLEMYRSPFVELDDMERMFGMPGNRIKRIAYENGVKRLPVSFRKIVKKRLVCW